MQEVRDFPQNSRLLPPPCPLPKEQSMPWYKKVFMKYSAAFAASVASKPDLNAYSGHWFWQGSYMKLEISIHTYEVRKRACSWPAPGMAGGGSGGGIYAAQGAVRHGPGVEGGLNGRPEIKATASGRRRSFTKSLWLLGGKRGSDQQQRKEGGI